MHKITHNDTTVAFVLNDTLVIDEATFNKLDGTTRGTILAANPAKSYDFRPNFADLTNMRSVRTKLLSGKDVSLELKFNGIEIEPDILTQYLTALTSITATLAGHVPKYNFAENPENNTRLKHSPSRISNSQHTCGIKTAQAIWKKASAYWLDPSQPAPSHSSSFGGYDRTAIIKPTEIVIGCQTITRWQLEQLAVELQWEFPSDVI